VPTANSSKSLKHLSKVRLLRDNPEAFLELLITESDRAVIIMFASAIEDCLEERLLGMMPTASGASKTAKDEREALFGFGGPLASFSNKINLAKALGLINSATGKSLHTLRSIRNQAAHAQTEITFTTPQISDSLLNLLPENFSGFWSSHALNRKALFSSICGSLAYHILGRDAFDVNKYISEIKFSWARFQA
jgi:hypothetical protein